MDEYEEQISKFQAASKCHRLKNTFQLVVSVALLSFFLCHASGFPLFPHSFNVYFSTFLFSFFTQTLERKYMFLICNGILAFLAKTSVYSGSSPSGSDLGGYISTPSRNLTQTKASVTDEVDGDYDHVPLVAEGEEPEDTYKQEVEEQDQENESLGGREVSVIVEDDEEHGGESGCMMKKESSVGVGAPQAASEEIPISTEELNRKFEEFIRKMKEEIRVEAQQQLIAV